MIETFKLNKRNESDVASFICDKGLYTTKDNKRKTVRTINDLKALNRESCFAIRKEEKDATKGLLFVWKSNAFNIQRNYVKVAFSTIQDCDDLLMVLNWSFAKEVYVKLDKNSPVINSFRKKGFKYCNSSRESNEVMLVRSKNERTFIAPHKEEDNDELCND